MRIREPVLLLLICHILLGIGSSAAAPLSAEAKRDLELRPGVVIVFIPLTAKIPEIEGVECPEGYGIRGSGFLFRPDGYLITNGHVAQMANLKDAEAMSARNAAISECLLEVLKQQEELKRQRAGQPPLSERDEQRLYALVLEYLKSGKITISAGPATILVCLDNRKCLNGEIKAYSAPFIDTNSPGKDVAIIKIDGHDLPTVPLGNSDEVNVNDPVFVIGYPGDADVSAIATFVATSTDGRISAVKRLERPDIPVLQTSALINPGNSGGPAFDGEGRVIGLATFKRGESYNYLVPINVAMELVRAAGVEPRRGAFDDLWQSALDAYADGHWGRARKFLQQVLRMMPDQPEAQRLEREAEANERLEGPWQKLVDSFGLPSVLGTLLAAVAACAAMTWLLFRSRAPALVRETHGPALKATRILDPATAQRGSPNFGTLHVSGGPMAGNRFPIPKAGLLIGRDPARCAVSLPDDSVSKEHAWVVPVDDGVAVIDRQSSNGTYVNSTASGRIDQVLLQDGDRIYLGKSCPTVFTYHRA